MSYFFPCLVRDVSPRGARYALGHPLLDRYLEFVSGRSRPNTLRAVAFDLKTFFSVVEKDPVEVAPADVLEFLAHQRGDRSVVRLSDRESGVSAQCGPGHRRPRRTPGRAGRRPVGTYAQTFGQSLSQRSSCVRMG
jgi:hypothetical protein